jgi:hypothetical protein
MNVAEIKELRARTHLEIAVSAAIAGGLAKDPASARRDMERIIEKYPQELKARWLRERHGGIKGWLCFLRSYGFEERLVVRRIPGQQQSANKPRKHADRNWEEKLFAPGSGRDTP